MWIPRESLNPPNVTPHRPHVTFLVWLVSHEQPRLATSTSEVGKEWLRGFVTIRLFDVLGVRFSGCRTHTQMSLLQEGKLTARSLDISGTQNSLYGLLYIFLGP